MNKKLIEQISEDAHYLGACDKITGSEDLEGIVRLLFSPQGREFCIKNQFPSMEVFRKFIKYHPDRYGVYIDAGRIDLVEPKDVFIVGNTTATIHIEATASHRICVMHGGSVSVYAGGYSVAKIECDAESASIVHRTGRARVL